MCVDEYEEGVKEAAINAFKGSSIGRKRKRNEIEKIQIPSHNYKLIGSFHNSTVRHREIDATIKLKKEKKHLCDDMKLHIEAFIKKCPICQKNSDKKNDNTRNRLRLLQLN